MLTTLHSRTGKNRRLYIEFSKCKKTISVEAFLAILRSWLVRNLPNIYIIPDSKVRGANMGSIWGLQDPGGPHVGPMNVAIWDAFSFILSVL